MREDTLGSKFTKTLMSHPLTHNHHPVHLSSPILGKRSIPRLLAPLYRLAENSKSLVINTSEPFLIEGQPYTIPRFVFSGPKGGIDPIRIGIFAGIHGDEPEGSLGLIELLTLLVQNPELGKGYQIFAYPLCNPTGYEDNSRYNRLGKDLNREFWSSSVQPEVFYLEQELWIHSFHGIISLHSDDTSHGLYGFVHGPDLSEELLKPALDAAGKILPRNEMNIIDGFKARSGIISEGYEGILAPPPHIRPQPFEIIFETPTHAGIHLQVKALISALKTILEEYPLLISIAQNI
jgi:protein MpaA